LSTDNGVPDYELVDDLEVSTPAQLRAMAHPLRSMILDLLLERAATVSELASVMGRPKSTVAHHVKVLVEAGMLRVVRTRRVRAIDERYYGRTARLFHVGSINVREHIRSAVNPLTLAAAEAVPAHEADDLRATLRHARIPREQAREFWGRVVPLLHEFAELPRSGDTVYGLAVGLYPTDHPTLPEEDSGTRDTGTRDKRKRESPSP
jgi:DNA-binding transcriptional ArsR family regulator